MRARHDTARRMCVALCAMTVFAVLTACASKFANLPDDLRVEAVSVVVDRAPPPEVFLGIVSSTEHNFPPTESGLTTGKIVSDVSRALKSELIPATRDGASPVNLRVAIYELWHPATGQEGRDRHLYHTHLSLHAHIDVVDARTGAALISEKKVWAVYSRRRSGGTMVQEYNGLISLFVAEMKDALLR